MRWASGTGRVRGHVVIVAAFLVAVVGIAYGRVLFGGYTFGGDHLLVEIPSRSFLSESLATGRIPEWWPHVGLGVPFAGNPEHLALYPPAWIVAVLPMPWAADVLLAVHALWAAFGGYLLARSLGSDRFGGVVSGCVLAACGVFGGSAGSATTLLSASWVPWMLVCGIALARATGWRDRVAHGAWLACCFGAALLAGSVSVAVAAAAVTICMAAVLGSRPLATAAAASVAMVGGVLPAAVLLLPALALGLLGVTELGGDGARALGYVWPVDGASGYVGIPALVLAGAAPFLVVSARGPAAVVAGAAILHVWVWAPVSIPACVLLCAMAGLGATELARRCHGHARMERALPAALAAVTIGVTVAGGYAQADLRPRAEIARRPALLPALEGAAHAPRIYRPHRRVIARYDRGGLADDHALAPANSATRFGYAYARGRDAAIPPRARDTWAAAAVASEAFFDLYDVEYMMVPASVVFPAGMPVVSRSVGGGLALVRNTARRARAFVAPQWVWHETDALLRGHLFSPGKGIRLGTVQLLGTGPPPPARRGAVPSPACTVRYPAPERADLACDSATGGYAVLVDAWAPGWSARVDGEAAPLLRADSLVRAVAVAPGPHEVTMAYRTPGLRIGAIISMLALLNVLALLVVRRRNRRP